MKWGKKWNKTGFKGRWPIISKYNLRSIKYRLSRPIFWVYLSVRSNVESWQSIIMALTDNGTYSGQYF